MSTPSVSYPELPGYLPVNQDYKGGTSSESRESSAQKELPSFAPTNSQKALFISHIASNIILAISLVLTVILVFGPFHSPMAVKAFAIGTILASGAGLYATRVLLLNTMNTEERRAFVSSKAKAMGKSIQSNIESYLKSESGSKKMKQFIGAAAQFVLNTPDSNEEVKS